MKKEEKNKDTNNIEYEDDGRVVADMSDIEPQPMLFPRFPASKKDKPKGSAKREANPEGSGNEKGYAYEQPARQIDRDERRILIKSSILAGLAVALLFAAVFGIVILLIGRM